MKGILKTLVLLAVPICLIGFFGCGQNIQTLSGDVDSIAKTNEPALEESSPTNQVPGQFVSQSGGENFYACLGYSDCTGGIWVEIAAEDPTESYYVGTDGVIWFADESICAGQEIDLLELLVDAYKDECASFILDSWKEECE